MRCAHCGGDSKVLETRQTDDGQSIRRRRECLECSRRFSTVEKVEEVPLIVTKKDGRRESFDRTKILNGLLKACERRPVNTEDLERVVVEIERELRNTLEREIPSAVIGEHVMQRLKDIDGVAYVRFASVYREFKDVNEFRKQLDQLLRG